MDENRTHPFPNTKKRKKESQRQRFSVSQLLNTSDSADSSSDDQVDESDASPCIIKIDIKNAYGRLRSI